MGPLSSCSASTTKKPTLGGLDAKTVYYDYMTKGIPAYKDADRGRAELVVSFFSGMATEEELACLKTVFTDAQRREQHAHVMEVEGQQLKIVDKLHNLLVSFLASCYIDLKKEVPGKLKVPT